MSSFFKKISEKIQSAYDYVTNSRAYSMISTFNIQYFYIVVPAWLVISRITNLDEGFFIVAQLNKIQNKNNAVSIINSIK